MDAFKRQTEIVHDDRDRAAYLIRLQSDCWRWRRILVDGCGLCRVHDGRWPSGDDVRKVSDLLSLAIFEDLYFFRLQICDRVTTLVGNNGINLNQIGRDTNDLFLTWC